MSRRRVFRVLAIYVAVGWGFTEIVQGVVTQVSAPPAIATFVTIAFIVGFPIILFLAWVFDVDRHGVHRVPARGRGQLLLSLSVAVLLSASYGIFRYLPRGEIPQESEPPDLFVMAVLPFRNLSASEDYDYMGQAIAEDLLNGVAIIPELKVKSTVTSFQLQGENPAVFAEQLGVNRLLDGTYREQDGNIRVAARMIDTANGDVVWTRVLTDSLGNIFQIQDQIARDVASELGLSHPGSSRNASRKVDPAVYQLYLQAREGFVNPWLDTENTMLKIRQVLDLSPNFPEALMMMGFLNTGFAWIKEDRQSPFLQQGEEYSLRALELDADLSEASAVLALNYALQYRWSESRMVANQAIEAAGARPLNVLYTFAYNNLGHSTIARDILLRVYDEDPLNFRAIQNLLNVYMDLGDFEHALQVEQILAQRGQRYQRHYLVEAYADKGDLTTARQLASLWAEEQGFNPEIGIHAMDALLGRRSVAFEAATDELYETDKLPMGQAIWNYMAAGASADKIFSLVRAAIPQGRFNPISLMHRLAAPYRQDPRWLEVYRDLGLVAYWKSVELPDFCIKESIDGLCG